MFKEIVEITDITNDQVKVKFNKQKMCSCCRYLSICGGGEEEVLIQNRQDLALTKGDKIEIGIEERKTVFAAFLLFLFPGLIFLLFLILFKGLHQFLSFFIAILAVFLYYLSMKGILRKKGKYFHLRILRKI